jgi:hypothetical protein
MACTGGRESPSGSTNRDSDLKRAARCEARRVKNAQAFLIHPSARAICSCFFAIAVIFKMADFENVRGYAP